MKKQLIIIGIIVIFIAITLSACIGKSEEDKFVGDWLGSKNNLSFDFQNIKFLSDGTFYDSTLTYDNGNWSVKDGYLYLENSDGQKTAYKYSFSNSVSGQDDRLKLEIPATDDIINLNKVTE